MQFIASSLWVIYGLFKDIDILFKLEPHISLCFSLDYSYASLISMSNEVYILRKHILHVFLFTWVGGIIFKTTFNNISAISWWLVLLVEFIHIMRYLIITH